MSPVKRTVSTCPSTQSFHPPQINVWPHFNRKRDCHYLGVCGNCTGKGWREGPRTGVSLLATFPYRHASILFSAASRESVAASAGCGCTAGLRLHCSHNLRCTGLGLHCSHISRLQPRVITTAADKFLLILSLTYIYNLSLTFTPHPSPLFPLMPMKAQVG